MGSNKSKRFVQQGVDSLQKYSERFPYRSTLAEAEEKKRENVEKSSYGGI
ncbi:competence protein [Litchfieldia alkalitelluris]|nr:competence protein [Litchfieldia alkalitelluris]